MGYSPVRSDSKDIMQERNDARVLGVLNPPISWLFSLLLLLLLLADPGGSSTNPAQVSPSAPKRISLIVAAAFHRSARQQFLPVPSADRMHRRMRMLSAPAAFWSWRSAWRRSGARGWQSDLCSPHGGWCLVVRGGMGGRSWRRWVDVPLG